MENVKCEAKLRENDGDLISREKLNNAIEYEYEGVCVYDVSGTEVIRDFQTLVDIQPAVDAAPVVHGEWKWSHGGQCSECGFHNSNFDYNFCPNCGAKMDGEANG